MELRAILSTIERSVAWHLASSFFSSYSQTGFVDSSFLHLLNHFKRYWTPFFFLFFCFFNRAGTNLMASFGPAHIPGIKPPSPPFFFLCLSFCEQGENKRPAQWSASQLASWIEGPLSWQFMSTPLQKHTYKSHPVLPSWTSDERMMIRMRDGPSFHCVFAPKSITFFHFCHI